MRSFMIFLSNLLLLFFSALRGLSFRKACRNVELTQRRVLSGILKENTHTRFGRDHDFHAITDLEDFRSRAPISSYEDYEEYIRLISRGEENILTAEPVLLFEPTSGSAAPTKFIPYTRSLRSQFQKGISAWLFDLYSKRRGLLFGCAYWQITPARKCKEHKLGRVPVGYDEDAEYFGMIERLVLHRLLPVPSEVSKIDDIETFRYMTLLFLLSNRNLVLISIWNPTFLTLLLKPVMEWHASLIQDIEKGTFSPPKDLDVAIREKLLRMFRRNRQRAAELRMLFRDRPVSFEKIWPNLCIISCWGDSWSAEYLGEIRALFPNTELQLKGLIATEAFISFPLIGKSGHALSIESHFFEFLELTDEGGQPGSAIRSAWELEKGRTYSVIVTTGGGLYRYRLHDIVEVTGFQGETPLLRFLGRENTISDIMGEKLNELHIAQVLLAVFRKFSLNPSFYMVAPEQQTTGEISYALFIEIGEMMWPVLENPAFAASVESGLQENFHYRYCRDLGQLSCFRIFRISPHSPGAAETYLSACRVKGRKLGDIKITVLDRQSGWSSQFKGSFV